MWATELFGWRKKERQKERRRPKKPCECAIEKCRGNTTTACSHMTRCFSEPQRFLNKLETKKKKRVIEKQKERDGVEQ